jgi:RNA recognition motif-containing protein
MSKLVCTHCGGQHLRFKCKFIKKKRAPEVKNVTVKLENLPCDISFNELNRLMQEWGEIKKISIKKRTYDNSAFIIFSKKDEAEYFVKAIDKTPFDNMILNASI